MRVSRIVLLLVMTVVVAALVVFLLKRPSQLEYKLSDGSVVRVEKISFGKREEFRAGGRMRIAKEYVMNLLAKRWPGRFTAPTGITSRWWNNSTVHTNTDTLHVWVTRRDAATGRYLNVDYRTAQLTDEHGCTFMMTQAGGQEDGSLGPNRNGYSVAWFTFEAFPRHEKNFRLRLSNYSLDKKNPEFTIPNPAPPSRQADWNAEPLPITKRDGDVAFTLTGIKVETNHYSGLAHHNAAPSFDVRELGRLTKEWQPLDMELYDGSGNFASKLDSPLYLCPWESVWKLVVRFFGSERSAVASNSVWTISGVKVPGAGEFVALNATNELEGVAMKAIALAGPGDLTYSNGMVVQASPLEGDKGDKQVNSRSSSSSGSNFTTTLSSDAPHVAVKIGPLSENQRLTLRATDDQGRQIYALEWGRYGENEVQKEIHYLSYLDTREANFLVLGLPKDAKTVDLTFCIHNARTEEFIFKPPMSEKRQEQ